MENKKQIVFLEAYSTVYFFKLAEEFKKRGYETILIRLLKPNPSAIEFYDSAYDRVIDFNLDYSSLKSKSTGVLLSSGIRLITGLINPLLEVKKLRPYVIIGRAAPSLTNAIFKNIFRKYPYIYFPYDIRTHFYPTKELAKKVGGLSNIEIWAERYCFEKCDGILHKGAKNELDCLNGRMLGDNLKFAIDFSMLPYCSETFIVPINKDKLSKKDKEFHLVHVGSSGVKKKQMIRFMFEDSKPFIRQKMHFHTFIRSNTKMDESGILEEFNEENKDYPNFKYFHVEEACAPKELIKKVSRFDFGLWQPFDPKLYSDYNLERFYSVGNKYATYLEAGIPYFYNSKSTFQQELNKKYKIDFPLTTEKGDYSIETLKKRIKKINLKQVEKNILKARKDFSVQKHFNELEEFIDKVVKNKNGS